MDFVGENPLVCGICQKEFKKVSNKDSLLRNIHNEDVPLNTKERLLCCLCPSNNRESFSRYIQYGDHLKNVHRRCIKEENLNFRSSEQFDAESLLEGRSKSVVGYPHSEDDGNLIMDEHSGSKLHYQDELDHFMQEIQPCISINTTEEKIKIAVEEFRREVYELEGDHLDHSLLKVRRFYKKEENITEICKKRKVEKQTYFPTKK